MGVLVLLLLVLVSEAVAVYSGGVGESEEGHHEGRSAGCNPIISHYLQLNNYYLTTCYNESAGSLCLTEVPLQQCLYPGYLGLCYYNRWTTHSITWNTIICQNPFSSGYCFLNSSIPVCSQERVAACCSTAAPTQTTTEPNTATTEPNTATTEPNTATTEPNTATTEPNTATTEPNTATTEPNTATTEPNTATTEPNTATTEPHTATTEPNTATTEPNSASTEPNQPTTTTEIPTATDGRVILCRSHQIRLGRSWYNFRACFVESEHSLCLAEAPPLQRCSFSGWCYTFRMRTVAVYWNIVICQNPFSPGFCFRRSSIPFCPTNNYEGITDCTCVEDGNGRRICIPENCGAANL